tara:strand:- start:37 stop:438 length:402 start_codon:yes stop_codon:yes gene_type:complete
MFKEGKDYDMKLNGLYIHMKGQGKGIKRYRKDKLFESKTYFEWADILEVSVNTIQKRMKCFGEPFYNGDRNFIGNASKHPPVPLYEGKTHHDWADILGITESTVRIRLNAYGLPYSKTVCIEKGLNILKEETA